MKIFILLSQNLSGKNQQTEWGRCALCLNNNLNCVFGIYVHGAIKWLFKIENRENNDWVIEDFVVPPLTFTISSRSQDTRSLLASYTLSKYLQKILVILIQNETSTWAFRFYFINIHTCTKSSEYCTNLYYMVLRPFLVMASRTANSAIATTTIMLGA